MPAGYQGGAWEFRTPSDVVHGLGCKGGSFKQVIDLSYPGEFLHLNGMHNLTLVLGHRSPLEEYGI